VVLSMAWTLQSRPYQNHLCPYFRKTAGSQWIGQ